MLTDADVERWLREDLGHRDVSNHVPGRARARLVATEPGVAAGVDAAVRTFAYLGRTSTGVATDADASGAGEVEATPTVAAGDRVAAGDVLLRVAGPARAVFRGERVATNLVGHASGVATRTREAVDRARAVADDVAVAATRKTTPGLRGVEKRAVAAGGGDTHRLDASGMVMVKDNHVARLGLERAVERLAGRASFAQRVDVEVETPEAGVRAADAGADVVLFDNCTPAEVARGVDLLPAGVEAEASGGVTVDAVADYAATGVDVVSMGSLTHSAPSLDCSFRVDAADGDGDGNGNGDGDG